MFVMQGALYSVAGWTIYLPEVAICSLFIIVFAWLNTKGTALSGQFPFFAVVLMILAVVVIIAFAPWACVGLDSIPQLAGEFSFSPKKALGLLMLGIIAATFIYLAMMLATSIAVGTHHESYEEESWPPAAAISDRASWLGAYSLSGSWRSCLSRARLACWERRRSLRWWSGLCRGWCHGPSRAVS